MIASPKDTFPASCERIGVLVDCEYTQIVVVASCRAHVEVAKFIVCRGSEYLSGDTSVFPDPSLF